MNMEQGQQGATDISGQMRDMFGGTNLQIAQQGKASKAFADSDAMRTAVPRDEMGRPTLPPNGLTLDMPNARELNYHDEVTHTDLFCD